ncbi:hypothetical protein EYZ11_001726 [Aspergillus tanneri]|uniref:DUF7702 domain-containing protein n=1 Tax=Aspergillus tanneri TaxID=1220188 RepID=A0A4S3JTQ8_9EURO|nr:hypothetical protein EYZ11_001726 [Aspergillus tanneri]
MPGDGSFRYRDGIAVAQVIAFFASLLFSFSFYYLGRISWFCIAVFSLIRLVGASCMLGTINNDSDGLWAGVFVCESLGMILIIFLLLEMLEWINKSTPTIHRRIFIIPQIITWIDIGISITGFIIVTHKDHALLPTPYSRVGITLVAAIYLWMVVTFVVFWLRRGYYSSMERRALMCVAACGDHCIEYMVDLGDSVAVKG